MTSFIPVHCRPARHDDLPVLVDLIGQLASFHGDTPTLDAATLERDAFGPERWIEALVAEHEGDVIGYALLYRIYRAQFGQRGIDLHHLLVDVPWRGKGIGRQLIEAVASRTRALGCSYLVVGTAADNVTAHRFYETLGLERAPPPGPRFRLALQTERIS